MGAGGGSIATWLCDRVGPTGHVVATDIDPRYLDAAGRPNLEVRRHDIASDPLPEAAFDLVHARLVLVHLPERENALLRIVRALKPGGWLLVEEFDSLSMRPDPAIDPDEVLLETYDALQRVMTARGVDLRYGQLLTGRFRAHGLVDVGAEGRLFMLQGGSPAPRSAPRTSSSYGTRWSSPGWSRTSRWTPTFAIWRSEASWPLHRSCGPSGAGGPEGTRRC